MEVILKEGKHFVLVHGASHGAWCWYKVKPLLQSAGHRVTAVDLAASGVHPKQIDGIHTLRDYTEPLIQLLGSIPDDDDDDQKVILVGHSLGGLNLAEVMELFPHKIEAAVFLAAFLPDTQHNPSFVFDQYVEWVRERGWLDTEFKCAGDLENSITTMLFGPKFLSLLYHLSPIEDLELAMMLKRPSSFFLHDIRKKGNYSEEKRRMIRQVYVVCNEDKGIPEDFQLWMANNGGLKEVVELQGSDHMPMISMPHKLCDCLVQIASI